MEMYSIVLMVYLGVHCAVCIFTINEHHNDNVVPLFDLTEVRYVYSLNYGNIKYCPLLFPTVQRVHLKLLSLKRNKRQDSIN